LKEPILIEIAEKLNKSPAQVALRWGIQSGHSVLPKSVNESRIKENLSLFDWCIPPELFSKFSQIHQVWSPPLLKHENIKTNHSFPHICINFFILLQFNHLFCCIMQQRLLRGDFAVHESCSPYKSLEELWDGEIWNGDNLHCYFD